MELGEFAFVYDLEQGHDGGGTSREGVSDLMMDQENHPEHENQDNHKHSDAQGIGAHGSEEHGHDCSAFKKRRQPATLKFKKRMYDGGNEVDLIRAMEKYHQSSTNAENNAAKTEESAAAGKSLESLKPLVETASEVERSHLRLIASNRHRPNASETSTQTLPQKTGATLPDNVTQLSSRKKVAEPETLAVQKKSRWVLGLQALLLGPLEVTVAVLGLITASFALSTYFYFQNQELKKQSQAVLEECKRTIVRGLKNCVTGPGRSISCLLGKC